MHRCPEYIIGVRITYFFELHNAIKSRTNYFNGQIIFLFCGNSFSFFVKLCQSQQDSKHHNDRLLLDILPPYYI